MQGNEPPFIGGLKAAKRILLELREKKINQKKQVLSQQASPFKASSSKPQKDSGEKIQSKEQYSQMVDASPSKEQSPLEKTVNLRQQIDNIGRQLYDCYCQNQSYEIILAHLVRHYGQNKEITEQNQKLKRKAFELQETINDYQEKIKINYYSIDEHQKQSLEMRKMTAEELGNFLKAEAQKAQEQPLPKIPVFSYSISQGKGAVQEQDEKERVLTLRYQSLSRQVARKPVRKVQPQQQQIRRSLYQSQLYTL